jgi:hypothetical protein
MSSDDEDFRLYARRRAARAVFWFVRFSLMAALALILFFSGLLFTQLLLPWVGIPMSAGGVALFCYAMWWVFAGRFRLMTCPICGVRGEFTKDEWAYFFHCPKCGRTADTRVPAKRTSAPFTTNW